MKIKIAPKTVVFIIICAALLLNGCKDVENSPDSISEVFLSKTAVTDGPQLYGLYCEGCHLELAATNKPRRTRRAIVYANSVVDMMRPLHQMPATVFAKIGAVLNGVAVDSVPATGAEWSDGYCMGCHGELANSEVRGAGTRAIRNAFRVPEMRFLNAASIPELTDTEIDKITAVLSQ